MALAPGVPPIVVAVVVAMMVVAVVVPAAPGVLVVVPLIVEQLFQLASVKSMLAGEAKNNFGLLIDNAQRAPVRIEKHGLPAAFVLSAIDFEQLVSGQTATGKGRGGAA